MDVSRVESPISGPPVAAWVKLNDEWVKVQVLTAISVVGCIKNRIRLPDGSEREVPNDALRFGRKPKSR